jgi:hypothetical protein
LAEKYYEEFLNIHQQLEQEIILFDNGIPLQFYRWGNSSSIEKLRKEVKYRGWFKDY